MTSERSTEVDVSIRTADGPKMIGPGGGAIRVTVDGKRVNRHADESGDWGEWGPEFVGDFLAVDIGEFVDAVERLESSEVGLHEELSVQLAGHSVQFLFEPLPEETVRVAYRTVDANRDEALLATPESARGYVVDQAALRRAVVDAGERFVARAKEQGIGDRVADFEAQLDRLAD